MKEFLKRTWLYGSAIIQLDHAITKFYFSNHSLPYFSLSYYIAEMDRCMFITDPYVSQIPAAALKKCQDDDPYTVRSET